jgi:hypothetical protein
MHRFVSYCCSPLSCPHHNTPDRQRSADADVAAATSPASGQQQQQQGQEQQQDYDAGPEGEGGLTGLEAALAAEAEAAAAGKAAAPAAADAAAGAEAVDPNNLRKVSLKFRVQFKLPPMLTVLRAARRWEPDIDAGNVRIFNGE